jgi:N-acyl-D-amino-acid deacylase
MPSTDVGAVSLEKADHMDRERGYVDLPPIAFGLYPHYIHLYVNERGALTLEEAVHKATYQVAQTIGIANRGILHPGAYADLVIFAPKKMRMTGDFVEPAKRPEGIETVLVNGTIVYRNREHTGARAGKVLRHETGMKP